MKAKIILGIALVALFTLCLHFSDFDNEKVATSILILILVIISFSGARVFQDKDKPYDYHWVENEMDKIYKDDGDFKYYHDGFYVSLNNQAKFIKWMDIIQIDAFSLSVIGNEQSGYFIKTGSEQIELNSIKLKGLEKFHVMLCENLDVIRKNIYEQTPQLPDKYRYRTQTIFKTSEA